MKKLHIIIYSLILISCKQISNDVENSFTTMSVKMDSLTKIENKKVEKLFGRINSKRIAKSDAENAALIYYGTLKYNKVIDSLISVADIETELNKINIAKEFNNTKSDLRKKLNSITEFNTKRQIDSLLQQSKDLEMLPKFGIIAELSKGKLDGTKSAELLFEHLNTKLEKLKP